MANFTTHLNQVIPTQAYKEVTINELFDAMSPAALFGRNALTTGGLVWGYYGGTFKTLNITNSSVNLTASAVNYIEADWATGIVSVNTTGFSGYAVKKPLYKVTTNTTIPTDYIDYREIDIPIATTSVVGGIKIGGGLSIDGAGIVSITTATSNTLGAIKIGTSLSITSGVVDIATASNTVLGGIKLGSSLSMNGSLQVNVVQATNSQLGIAAFSTGLSIDGAGNVTLNQATTTSIGGVSIASGLSVSSGALSVAMSYNNYTDLANNPATTTALVYGYKAGIVRLNNAFLNISAGTLTLGANTTSYVECNSAGTVSFNTTSFTADSLPIAIVITGASSISNITDRRSLLSLVPAGGYILPTATTSILGGVKIGSGLSITSGVVSTAANNPIVNGALTGASITLDTSLADVFEVPLTNPTTTFTLTNGQSGKYIILKVKQDSSGARFIAFAGTNVRFGTDLTSLTLSTSPNMMDYIGLRYDASSSKFDVIAFIRGFV